MRFEVNSENNAIRHFLNVCREAANKESVNASLNMAYLRSGILQFVEYQAAGGKNMMLPYREASSSLERARLFEISRDDYREMHVAIHESLGLAGEQPGDEELVQYQPAVEDLISKVPFPPRLPFPHIYIGISSPIVTGLTLLCGFLLNQHGQAWELSIDHSRAIPIVMPLTTSCSSYPDAPDKTVGIWRSRVAGQYSPAAFLMYEIVQAIIGFQNLKIEVPDLLTKILAKKNRAPGFPKIIPPPFYRIPLTNQVERVKLQIQRREISSKDSSFSYVHDVRGHWVTRIVKGATPADPKVLKRLAKRGYLVWTDKSKMPKEYHDLLSKRGVYVNSDEWIAILRSWRSDFLRPKNRPDLPYIPATRVMSE